MKKILFVLFGLLASIMITACGTDNQESTSGTNDEGTKQQEATTEDTASEAKPIEPTHEHMCAFCNMKIYTKEEDMGVFTAQAVNKEGENIFFDDSGCILNYERKTGEEFEVQWVRDYLTSEWIDATTSIPVKADIQTPMKYGYAFFADQESADTFIKENKDLNATSTTWEDIDKIANERYKMKMKKMSNSNEKNDEMEDMK